MIESWRMGRDGGSDAAAGADVEGAEWRLMIDDGRERDNKGVIEHEKNGRREGRQHGARVVVVMTSLADDTSGADLLLATVVRSSPLASSCIRPISRGLSLGKMSYKLIIKIFAIYVCMGSNLEAPMIF